MSDLRLLYALVWADRSHLLPAVAKPSPTASSARRCSGKAESGSSNVGKTPGHVAAMSGAARPLLADRVLVGLDEAQLRARPASCLNSIAWLLWHLARSEDVLINVLLTGGPQILDIGGWPTRLNLTERDMGSGMTSAQVDIISAHVALPALHDYLVAVGRRTRAVLTGLRADDWRGTVEPDRLLAAGAFANPEDGVRRVATFWRGRTRDELLISALAPHNCQHLGEAPCTLRN